MNAEVLAIGDEIMSGRILDTNSQWLSQQLEERGIRVLYHSGCGDEVEPLADVFRRAIGRAEVVISTGGLGPTADDVTREAVAAATGRELRLDPSALEHVRSMFARRRRDMPQQNEKQAWLPAGAQLVRNPNGTAPGIDLEIGREGRPPSRVICLPGVPAEMREMWDDSVRATVEGLAHGLKGIRHKAIKCFGAGESHIEAMLPEGFLRQTEPRIGINASQTSIILRVAAEGATEAECDAAMRPAIDVIRQRLGNLVFGEDDDELETVVARLLKQQGKSLATVEWGTGGLIADWLGALPAADEVYRGGFVVRSDDGLRGALGLSVELTRHHDLGGSEMTQAMAVSCRKQFGADLALAVGRFPDSVPAAGAPLPFYLAIAGLDGVRVREAPYAGHPAVLRVFCGKQALNYVRLALVEG
ncbi:MAG: CinA family nicotinamide mononucleotide deamidase-related protein [Planctomycetota bacterium]